MTPPDFNMTVQKYTDHCNLCSTKQNDVFVEVTQGKSGPNLWIVKICQTCVTRLCKTLDESKK